MNKQPIILIADDSHGHLALMDIILTSDSHTVVTCADGKEVLEYLKNHTPDLIILDIEMPYISGTDICQRVKSIKRLQHTPVILITSLADEQTADRAVRAKADLLLQKPYPMKELKREINAFLEKPVELYRAPHGPREEVYSFSQ